MNILIPDSWLREHLHTKAAADQIAEALSLCSQSVEKIHKFGRDSIYEIEITTNRPDCLSVYGIARELAAILPRFNTAAQLQPIPELAKIFPQVKKSLALKIKIQKPSLCPRFTALIFDQVKYQPSPQKIQDRLKKAGIRALNNIVDISNYLMLELGQPMHTFDYDKIKKNQMVLRESKTGEKLITLDGQNRQLPAGTMVIEDGSGRLVDLCGIMGGQNSAVDEKTQRVLLFVQTYDPAKIRQTCQKLSFRTDAAQRFEKGVEPEGVMPAMKKAMAMFQDLCQAQVASRLIDIYPQPTKLPTITLEKTKLNQIMGVKISLTEAEKILRTLKFKVKLNAKKTTLQAIPPDWRQGDIGLPEDLIEEVARIYGYHNLPSILPSGPLPQSQTNPGFQWENQIKQALKYWGFIETANYSLISKNLVKKAGFQPQDCLKIANPLTKDLVYLRPSLLPSLLQAVGQNKNREKVKIFELSNIYLPQAKNQLPQENLRLTGLIKGAGFFQAKGFVEAILSVMNIRAEFKSHRARIANVIGQKKDLGQVGELKTKLAFFDLDFDLLVSLAKKDKQYHPLAKYPAVIEDFTFSLTSQTNIGKVIKTIKAVNPLIQSVTPTLRFENKQTFRISYQHPEKNLSRQQVKKIRKKILKTIKSL